MKKQLLLYLLTVVILLSSCHQKESNKAIEHAKHIKQSSKVITVSQKDDVDFTQLDTKNFYFGEIDEDNYFFIIDNVTAHSVHGRYYVVNEETEAEAKRFEIEQKDGEYLFCTSNNDIPVKFEINIDSASITGTVKTSISISDKKFLAFEKYREPEFSEPKSTRYLSTHKEQSNTDYKIKKDVVYGEAMGYWASNPIDGEKYGKILARSLAKTLAEKSVKLDMDIYMPNDNVKKHPLLVFIHGGAFFVGDKEAETMTKWCEHFTQIGYVTASINYRMGFTLSKKSIQKCGYEAIQDAHAAIRYLVAHADEYKIDPSYIFVGGTSAGSITALGMAFMTNATRPPFVFENNFDQKLGNIESSSNNLKTHFKIKALANMWGAVYDLDELNGHNIPVISFHGTEDNLVPFDEGYPFADIKGKIGEKLFDKMYGSKSIHERLDSLHIHNEFHPIEGVKHAPYQDKAGHPNATYYFIQEKMENFFYNELRKVSNIVKSGSQTYSLPQNDIATIQWKAIGGFILNTEENNATILWRKDAPKKELIATGTRQNGCAYVQHYTK